MADHETTTALQTKALPIPAGLKSLLEGLIFAAEEPLTVRQIKAIYEQPVDGDARHIEPSEIQEIITTLNEEYRTADRPYRIIMIAGGYQFATLKEYGEWLGRLFHEQARRRLSQSSLETLAIVAYRQPVSKPEIEAIRGVNCDYVLKTLLEKDLVTITGRAETVGRPLLYGTTREFLKHFGLNDVTDLPRPREIEEILGESQFETERRMLEAQAGADMAKKEEEDFKSRLPHIPKKKPELSEEVQIIPKTRARRLNVLPREERAPVEDAPAEEPAMLPVVSDQTGDPAGVTQEAEPDTSPGEITDEQVPASPAPGTVAPIEDMSSRDERTVEPDEMPAIPLPEEPAVADDPPEEEPAPQIFTDAEPPPVVHPKEPEETQPRRTAWTSWKARIQTFIRKLFG
jgi:segregation and condensation protein B